MTTLEIEQKFADVDHEALRRRLLAVGARRGEAHRQTDEYLSHPSRNFGKTHEALRIRTLPAGCILTYKGPQAESQLKIRPEIESEFPLAQADSLRAIFAQLGFETIAFVAKTRETWELNRGQHLIKVEVDFVDGLGCFAEIEILAGQQGIPAATEITLELAAELGLVHPIRKSYLALLLAERRVGLRPRVQVLSAF